MGYIRHDAIIVTGPGYEEAWVRDVDLLRTQMLEASRLDNYGQFLVGPVRGINDTISFAILPDGSKEGWGPSDSMDEFRRRLRRIAERHELDYAEVRFGGDDPELAEAEFSRREVEV